MNPQEHVAILQARLQALREALLKIADLADYEDTGAAVDIAVNALLKDDGGID